MTQITALYPGLADTCSKAGCLNLPLDAKENLELLVKRRGSRFHDSGRGVAHYDEAHAIWGPGNGGSGAPRSYFLGGINGNAVNVIQGY